VEWVILYTGVTERGEVGDEREQTILRFKKLFNSIPDPVVMVNHRGEVVQVTEMCEAITGFKEEELVGMNFMQTNIFTCESKALMMRNLTRRMRGEVVPPYEVKVLGKDGLKRPLEVNAIKIDYEGKPVDLVVFRDITERKKMEEKLRVLSGLTRHDIRNRLFTLMGRVYLAKRKLADGHEALKHVREAESVVHQIERIIDFARDYEESGREELAYIDVEQTVEEAVSFFPEARQLEVVNDCKGLKVLADSLLRQLFYNLVDNSIKHGETVSKIRVHFEEAGNGEIKLIYEDDGVGLPTPEKENIFKKGYGEDTGYGLYMIKKTCEVYGWNIKETGKEGKGVQFTMTIPPTIT
jgi:PAS domain S-box-containing protein